MNTNKIYSYIKEFKKHNDNNKVLDITYELYYFKDYGITWAFNISDFDEPREEV